MGSRAHIGKERCDAAKSGRLKGSNMFHGAFHKRSSWQASFNCSESLFFSLHISLLLLVRYIQQHHSRSLQRLEISETGRSSVVPLARTCRTLLLHALAPRQFSCPFLSFSVPLVGVSLFAGLLHGCESGCFVLDPRVAPGLRAADAANGFLYE